MSFNISEERILEVAEKLGLEVTMNSDNPGVEVNGEMMSLTDLFDGWFTAIDDDEEGIESEREG